MSVTIFQTFANKYKKEKRKKKWNKFKHKVSEQASKVTERHFYHKRFMN